MALAASIGPGGVAQALLMNSEDYAEFHAAFNAKRPPDWQGR